MRIAERRFRTLAQAVAAWQASTASSEHMRWRRGHTLGKLTRFGIVKLSDVTPERFEAFVRKRLSECRAPSTVQVDTAMLFGVLAWLADGGQFPAERLAELRMLRPDTRPRPSVRVLSSEEERRLLDATARLVPRIELPMLVALHAGLRVREVAALWREDCLDTPRPALAVTSRPDFGAQGSLRTKGERIVPIPGWLLERLQASTSAGWLFPAGPWRGAPAPQPHLSRGTLERDLVTARLAANVSGATFEALRETCAARWNKQGVSVPVIAERLGLDVVSVKRLLAAIGEGK